ncbi:MAG: BON domain-containing protein, partial [Planctomycetaceae bacterium]
MSQCKVSTIIIALTAAVLLAAGPESVFAQANSLFGNRGPFSQSNTRVGTPLSQSRGVATPPTTFGQQPTNAFNVGSGGTTGQALNPTFSGLTTGNGTGTFGSGFVGQSNTTGFVGNRLAGQQGAGNLNQFSQFGGGFGNNRGANQFGDNQFGNQTGNQEGTRRVIRPRQRIAFTYPERGPQDIGTSLRTQFTRLADRNPELADLTIEMDGGGTVVIRGEVDTLDQKKLAAALVRLEPGVRTVLN